MHQGSLRKKCALHLLFPSSILPVWKIRTGEKHSSLRSRNGKGHYQRAFRYDNLEEALISPFLQRVSTTSSKTAEFLSSDTQRLLKCPQVESCEAGTLSEKMNLVLLKRSC